MRKHNHEVGEQGNFWTLDLGVSNYITPKYEDMKTLWEETLNDSMVWTCPAKTLMIEVVYSIVSLHLESKRKNEDKKGVRLSPWHIHILVYADGYSPEILAKALKESWVRVANKRQDWKEKVMEGKKRDGTWGQGCHSDVAIEKYQTDTNCYSRGRVAYMMWQAIHKKTYSWRNGEPKEIPLSEMLRRLRLATENEIQSRTDWKKKKIIGYWIEWAQNVKVALANIPSHNNPYRMADMGARLIHDVATNDSTYSELQSKISKIPDINTPTQWGKVYDVLVKNLETAGVQGLIAEGYEAIKEELKDTKPLVGITGSIEGTITARAKGDNIELEVRPGLDMDMVKQFEGIAEGITIIPWKPE